MAKTLARQFSREVEEVCSPFQFALSTRAGVDCVGQGGPGGDPMLITPRLWCVDGVGAYDHVLRATLLAKLLEVPRL